MFYVYTGVTPVSREGKPGTEQELQPYTRVYEANAPEHADHRGYLSLADAWRMEPEARQIITIMMGGDNDAVH